jgi:hypothetical protein
MAFIAGFLVGLALGGTIGFILMAALAAGAQHNDGGTDERKT